MLTARLPEFKSQMQAGSALPNGPLWEPLKNLQLSQHIWVLHVLRSTVSSLERLAMPSPLLERPLVTGEAVKTQVRTLEEEWEDRLTGASLPFLSQDQTSFCSFRADSFYSGEHEFEVCYGIST